MSRFQLVSPHHPAGDQPGAIAELTEGLERGDQSDGDEDEQSGTEDEHRQGDADGKTLNE